MSTPHPSQPPLLVEPKNTIGHHGNHEGCLFYVFATFWMGFICFMIVATIRGYVENYLALDYPTAQGVVVDSRVVTRSNSKGGRSYSTKIRYQYKVGERVYEGDRVHPGMGGVGAIAPAHTLVARHPVGSTVQVYYNPRAPYEAMLYPGFYPTDVGVALFFTPFVCVGIGMFVMGHRSGKRKTSADGSVIAGRKVRQTGKMIHMRVAGFSPSATFLIALLATSFAMIFVVNIIKPMRTSFSGQLSGIAISWAAAAAAAWYGKWRARDGRLDLGVQPEAGMIFVPAVDKRPEPTVVPAATLWAVEIAEHLSRTSKGRTRYSYSLLLHLKPPDGGEISMTATDTMPLDEAREIAQWLIAQVSSMTGATGRA